MKQSEKLVKVETAPPGCPVNINGLLAGTTPCTCVVLRRGGYIEFEVLPPRDSAERLWVQRRSFTWAQLPPEGAVLYFDLRLEATSPLQPIEIREQ